MSPLREYQEALDGLTRDPTRQTKPVPYNPSDTPLITAYKHIQKTDLTAANAHIQTHQPGLIQKYHHFKALICI